MTEQTNNLNWNECFKSISNIGSTTYQNICDGSMEVVPWGVTDWISAFFISLMVVGSGMFLISLFLAIKNG